MGLLYAHHSEKDVRIPLVSSKRVRHKKGEWFEIFFVYEKLPNFCFICGMLDHTKWFGRSLLDQKEKPIMRKFDPELRASYCRNNNFIGVRRLREEGQGRRREVVRVLKGAQILESFIQISIIIIAYLKEKIVEI